MILRILEHSEVDKKTALLFSRRTATTVLLKMRYG